MFPHEIWTFWRLPIVVSSVGVARQNCLLTVGFNKDNMPGNLKECKPYGHEVKSRPFRRLRRWRTERTAFHLDRPRPRCARTCALLGQTAHASRRSWRQADGSFGV